MVVTNYWLRSPRHGHSGSKKWWVKQKNHKGSTTVPTRLMDKLGGDTAKIYYLERHLANCSIPVEFFNTFYIWPATLSNGRKKVIQPVACVMRDLKHLNMSWVPVRQLLLMEDTLGDITVYWTSWLELNGTWWCMGQLSQHRNLLLRWVLYMSVQRNEPTIELYTVKIFLD